MTLKEYVLEIISKTSGIPSEIYVIAGEYFFDSDVVIIIPETDNRKRYVRHNCSWNINYYNVPCDPMDRIQTSLLYAVYDAWESKRYDCVLGLLGSRSLDKYPQCEPGELSYSAWANWTTHNVGPIPKNMAKSSEISYVYVIGNKTVDEWELFINQCLILPCWAYPNN